MIVDVDKESWSQKLAYLYWYESVTSKGWKLSNEQVELYEKIKSEVMHYGYDLYDRLSN